MIDKPYGHEVDVECCKSMIYVSGSPHNFTVQVHRKGSESAARRAAMLRPHARAIVKVKVKAFTQAEWERAFGLNQRM